MVEIIPKPAERISFWQNLLFYLSFGLFLGVVSAYFILNVYLNRAQISLKNLEETLAKEKGAEILSLEEKIFGSQKKIEDFSKLIGPYLFSSKFFKFIEENTHPQIWFSQLTLNPGRKEAKLKGEGEDLVVLAQQFQIFRTNPLVKKLNLIKVGLGKEGRVGFDLELHLDPSLFK